MKNELIGVITTHIYPSKGYGGPSVSCAELIFEWSNRTNILLTSSDASIESHLNIEHLKFNTSTVTTKLYRTICFKKFGFGFGAIYTILYLCYKCKYIYINGIATWPTTLGAVLCFLFSRDYVVSLRGGLMQEHVDEIRKNKKFKLLFYKFITIPLLNKAKGIHCSSESEKNSAKNFIRTEQSLFIIPNGVKIPKYKIIKKPLQNSIIFGYFGRISEEKGINRFLNIWLKNADKNSHFIIAGSGRGSYFNDFLGICEKNTKSIKFIGYLDKHDLSNAMNDCHFIVLPSGIDGNNNRENFGNSAAEALALGRPIIVSKGLSWDDIEDEEAGFLFPRKHSGARMVIDRATRIDQYNFDKMCENARNYAVKKLDIRHTAERMRDKILLG